MLLWGGSRDREGTCSRKADIRHSKDSCLEEQKKKLKSRLGWTCTWALRRAGIRTTRGKGATYYWWITRCKLGEKEKETREASGHSWHPFSGTHGWCDSTDLQADGPLQILFFYHLPHNSGLIPEVSNPPKVETKEDSFGYWLHPCWAYVHSGPSNPHTFSGRAEKWSGGWSCIKGSASHHHTHVRWCSRRGTPDLQVPSGDCQQRSSQSQGASAAPAQTLRWSSLKHVTQID